MKSLTDNPYFRWEFSLDVFLGLIFGDFPSFSRDIYMAELGDKKVEAALNFTTNFKVQILNLVKLDFEFEFTPAMASGGVQDYHTAYFGDNCLLLYYDYNVLKYNTRIRKQFAECGMNLRELVDESETWADLVKKTKF